MEIETSKTTSIPQETSTSSESQSTTNSTDYDECVDKSGQISVDLFTITLYVNCVEKKRNYGNVVGNYM